MKLALNILTQYSKFGSAIRNDKNKLAFCALNCALKSDLKSTVRRLVRNNEKSVLCSTSLALQTKPNLLHVTHHIDWVEDIFNVHTINDLINARGVY